MILYGIIRQYTNTGKWQMAASQLHQLKAQAELKCFQIENDRGEYDPYNYKVVEVHIV